MRIAVSIDNENIFTHVGNAKEFKIYDIQDNKVISSEIHQSSGKGREMVINFVTRYSCNILICNEICSGAKSAVEETGVQVYGAVTGNADAAVEAFLRNELVDGDTVVCHHE